jgi:hypothetical protein
VDVNSDRVLGREVKHRASADHGHLDRDGSILPQAHDEGISAGMKVSCRRRMTRASRKRWKYLAAGARRGRLGRDESIMLQAHNEGDSAEMKLSCRRRRNEKSMFSAGSVCIEIIGSNIYEI